MTTNADLRSWLDEGYYQLLRELIKPRPRRRSLMVCYQTICRGV